MGIRPQSGKPIVIGLAVFFLLVFGGAAFFIFRYVRVFNDLSLDDSDQGEPQIKASPDGKYEAQLDGYSKVTLVRTADHKAAEVAQVKGNSLDEVGWKAPQTLEVFYDTSESKLAPLFLMRRERLWNVTVLYLPDPKTAQSG